MSARTLPLALLQAGLGGIYPARLAASDTWCRVPPASLHLPSPRHRRVCSALASGWGVSAAHAGWMGAVGRSGVASTGQPARGCHGGKVWRCVEERREQISEFDVYSRESRDRWANATFDHHGLLECKPCRFKRCQWLQVFHRSFGAWPGSAPPLVCSCLVKGAALASLC